MRNKVQDLIEAKEIEFDAPEKPNVITAPMPKHDSGVNVIEVVSAMEDADDEEESDIDIWIYPTTNGGQSNWTTRDFIPVSFIPQ